MIVIAGEEEAGGGRNVLIHRPTHPLPLISLPEFYRPLSPGGGGGGRASVAASCRKPPSPISFCGEPLGVAHTPRQLAPSNLPARNRWGARRGMERSWNSGRLRARSLRGGAAGGEVPLRARRELESCGCTSEGPECSGQAATSFDISTSVRCDWMSARNPERKRPQELGAREGEMLRNLAQLPVLPLPIRLESAGSALGGTEN